MSRRRPFQLTTVLGVAKQAATSAAAEDMQPKASSWEAIADLDAIVHLIEESGNPAQPILEP